MLSILQYHLLKTSRIIYYSTPFLLFFLRGWKYAKISSSDRPLVSGIINCAHSTVNKQKKANAVQTVSMPYFVTTDGYIFTMTNHKTCPQVFMIPLIVPVNIEKQMYQIVLWIMQKLQKNIIYIFFFLRTNVKTILQVQWTW